MGRVGRALALHELTERTRDRWVLVVSVLFAALASAVGLYGDRSDAGASTITGPSLVTLASLLVPLVALVLSHDAIVGERERNTLGLLLSLPVTRTEVVLAKFLGRAVALALAVGLGLGAAMLLSNPTDALVLGSLVGPTYLLGVSFLSLGMLISSVTTRQATAASMVVAVWFLLVFFYDLGLLGLLVATDGSVSQDTIAWLVFANPAGLYRVQMMHSLAGAAALEGIGLTTGVPSIPVRAMIWAAWVALPLAGSALVLTRARVMK
jgi:Cu-processing system permease protein